jgi:hypothetical protein
LIEEEETENNNLIKYSDKELWISFSYPKNWWDVKKDYNISWKEWLYSATLSLWDKWYFSFANWKTPPWRWLIWSENSRSINNQEYIMNFCDEKKINKSRWEKCELKKNKNDIYYVKAIQEYKEMWEDKGELKIFYKIYNKNSSFFCIAASNQRFDIGNEEDFDLIIENLLFLEK